MHDRPLDHWDLLPAYNRMLIAEGREPIKLGEPFDEDYGGDEDTDEDATMPGCSRP